MPSTRIRQKGSRMACKSKGKSGKRKGGGKRKK